MNPLFRIDFSISDSLKIVRKSVLIYETIISGHRSSVDTGQMGFVSDGVPGWIAGQYHLTKKDG